MFKEVLLVFVFYFVTRYGLATNGTYDGASKVEPTFYGEHNQHTNLEDGRQAKRIQFPYTVKLISKKVQNYENGVIVSKEYVLTSAWSIKAMDFNDSSNLAVQCPNQDGEIQEFYALNTYCHNKYDSYTRINNIGLIKIKGTFTYAVYVKPIKLSWRFPSSDIPIIISSWGNNNILQFSESYSIDKWRCSQVLKTDEHYLLHPPSVGCCYRSAGVQAYYDNGAPVVHDGELIGIVSEYCYNTPVHLFTKISHHRKWIEDIVGGLHEGNVWHGK